MTRLIRTFRRLAVSARLKSAVPWGTGLAALLLLTAPTMAQLSPGSTTPAPAPISSPPVQAPVSAENEALGRKHYKRGDELFKAGKYLDAAKEFEAGFNAAPRPLFLLNIGHSYRKGQELKRARQAYEEYLKADPSTPFRADVEDLMKNIDDALSASSIPGAPPSTTTVTPPPTALPASAAPAPIDLPRPVIVEVDRGPAPPSDSGSRPLLRNPWFWSAVGAVVVAGIAGTIYGVTRPPACQALRCLRETD
jgi:hypothetical protein